MGIVHEWPVVRLPSVTFSWMADIKIATHSVLVVGGPSCGMAVNLKEMSVLGVQSTVSVTPMQAHTSGHCA